MARLLLLLALLAALVVPPAISAADPHPSASLPTYYELLESPPTATDKELKKAYRRLALTTHPDKATSDTDRTHREDQFIRLSNAYEVLSSAELRPRYDYLLTQSIHVYDDRVRDWSMFDAATGEFSRQTRHTVSFGDGRFSFSSNYADARQRWEAEQAEEARETRALLLALVGSLAVAVTPVGYYYYQQLRQRMGEKRRKAEASVRLKVGQQALAELHEERAEEEKQRKEEERRRAAELRRQRKEAEQENEDEAEEEADGGQQSHQGQDEAKGAATKLPSAQADEVAAEGEEEEEEKPRKGGSSVTYGCELCRKKFKSEQQSVQHVTHSHTHTHTHTQTSAYRSVTLTVDCHMMGAGTTTT